MRPDIVRRLNELRVRRKAVIVVTDLGDGSDRLIVEGEVVMDSLQEAVSACFRKGVSSQVRVDDRALFLNVHLPPATIVVVGAVHIAQVLAPMARLAGFPVKIIDPRSAFATLERFPGTELIVDWPQDVFQPDAYTALVAVSHVPHIDDLAVVKALEADCFYVGALGSRKSHAARLGRLKERGADEALLSRIHAPIGLDIGAANPAEIAVSILGDIIQSLRRRDVSAGKSLTT